MTIFIIISLFAFVSVAAQEEGDSSTNTNMPTQIDAQTKRAEAAARITELKEKRQTTVDEARRNIITGRCKAAQSKLASFATRVENGYTRRSSAYLNISEKISNLLTRLENNEIDVGSINELLITFNSMYESVLDEINDYLTVLVDASEMDCESDPEGFQAALEEARETAATLKDNIKALHNYLIEEIKPAIRSLMSGATSDIQESESGTESE